MENEKIISLVKMSKSGNSCRVEFLEGENIYLPIDLILKFNLKTGKVITNEIFIQIIDEKKIIEAKRYAYNIVSKRLHSEYEINQKLKNKGFETNHIEKALNFLKSQNLINDFKFAEQFASSSFKRKGYVDKRIFFELKKKGIDADIAKVVSQKFVETIEIEDKIKLLIEKKLRLRSNKSQDKQKAYILRSLSDLGYDYKIINSIINNYFEMS